MKMKLSRVVLLLGFLTVSGCAGSQNALTMPTPEEIRTALFTDNPHGFTPGLSWTPATLPPCTIPSNAFLTYYLDDTPAWIDFWVSSRELKFASGVSTIPSSAASAIDVVYRCFTGLPPYSENTAVLRFRLNDIDDDGYLDSEEYDFSQVPLVSNGGTIPLTPATIAMYRGGVSSFKISNAITVAAAGMSPLADDTVADSDGDGVSNVAELAAGTNMFVASSAGTFDSGTDASAGTLPTGIVTADFNNDGKLDVAVAALGEDVVRVLRGNGDGTFLINIASATGDTPQGIAAGDLNGDGYDDLVVSNSHADSVSVLIGNGDMTFADKVDVATADDVNTIAIGDFDGDGDLDLATADFGIGGAGTKVSVLPGNGDGTFGTRTDYTVGIGPSHIITADFDGDGDLDLAVTNWNNGTATTFSVLLGGGDGTFAAATNVTTNAPGPRGIVSADFNGDGKLDVALANNGQDNQSSYSVFMGNGDGTFATGVDYTARTGPFDMLAYDVDGDGDIDLLVAHFDGQVTVNKNNGSGVFTESSSFTADGGNDFYITVGDMNNDGKLDLISSNFSNANLSVFLNQ